MFVCVCVCVWMPFKLYIYLNDIYICICKSCHVVSSNAYVRVCKYVLVCAFSCATAACCSDCDQNGSCLLSAHKHTQAAAPCYWWPCCSYRWCFHCLNGALFNANMFIQMWINLMWVSVLDFERLGTLEKKWNYVYVYTYALTTMHVCRRNFKVVRDLAH